MKSKYLIILSFFFLGVFPFNIVNANNEDFNIDVLYESSCDDIEINKYNEYIQIDIDKEYYYYEETDTTSTNC
ncbi:MAG: hypothetical protein ACOC2U_01120, partial [bacterium]